MISYAVTARYLCLVCPAELQDSAVLLTHDLKIPTMAQGKGSGKKISFSSASSCNLDDEGMAIPMEGVTASGDGGEGQAVDVARESNGGPQPVSSITSSQDACPDAHYHQAISSAVKPGL